MSENQRKYPRKEIRIEVALSFMEDQARSVITRDISEGGLFMMVDDPNYYPLGEMVSLAFQDPLNSLAHTHKEAIVVRHDAQGIGVALQHQCSCCGKHLFRYATFCISITITFQCILWNNYAAPKLLRVVRRQPGSQGTACRGFHNKESLAFSFQKRINDPFKSLPVHPHHQTFQSLAYFGVQFIN